MGSRIIMVVDAFDAMTSDRPYRRGLAPEVAYEELQRHSDTQFFREIVDALVELHSTSRLLDDIDVDELEMYTSDRYNSKILEEHVRRKLEETYGPDKHRLEKASQRFSGTAGLDLPVVSTIDPNASCDTESGSS
jgi:hypothetical protein